MSRWNPFAKPRPDVRPGQVSVPDPSITNVIGMLTGFYSFANPTFPFEFLEILGPLGIFNPDVSQALSIWVNLGNTGHEVMVDGKNPEAVLQRLNYLAANVYRTGGGIDALVNHFLRQIPLMGALSGEWVVAPNVAEGMVDVAVVPVKYIRFKYEEGIWAPYQLAPIINQGNNLGIVALNPLTYSYSPMQTDDGCPYGIPPFYAALKNIETQIDATGNIASIIRKMGLLGFLDVALEVPDQRPQESDEAYKARLAQRLKDYAASYKANLSRGVAVHYKDQEIQHNAIGPGAAAGAKQVWEMNEEQIFSALDIPPSMAGRSYSTTETYAEVDYQRLTTKMVNGRRCIKRFIEKGYTLDLLLRGIDAQVGVNFHPDSGYKALEQAQAEEYRIKNVLSKRDAGIIDQDTAARELGYDKAAGGIPDAPPPGFFGEAKRFIFNRATGRYAFAPERIVLETPADDRHDQSYIAALESVLDDCETAAIEAALKAAGKEYSSASDFAQAVYNTFANNLRAEIARTAVMKICKRFVSDEWRRWRYEDKNHLKSPRLSASPFAKGGTGGISFDGDSIDIALVDKNALRYLTHVEDFYFGRGNYLANNETTGKEFVNWLQEEYIAKGLSLKDDATWEEFKRNFAGLIRETSYRKIEQIVSTTMGRVQNMGQVLSLHEAGIKRYMIVGPKSAPCCQYCISMVGRTFDVKVAATRLAKILEKGFESPADLPPFLSSKYTEEQVKEMSDAELQAAGYTLAPFHPKCRHRTAAVD